MIDVAIMWPVWILLAALMVVVGLSMRARRRASFRSSDPVVDDEALRAILEDGVITTEEDPPIDLDHIRKEEESFWDEERWDEAEEY